MCTQREKHCICKPEFPRECMEASMMCLSIESSIHDRAFPFTENILELHVKRAYSEHVLCDTILPVACIVKVFSRNCCIYLITVHIMMDTKLRLDPIWVACEQFQDPPFPCQYESVIRFMGGWHFLDEVKSCEQDVYKC